MEQGYKDVTRIIACLDLLGDRVVKGTKFNELKDVGSGVDLAKYYQEQGADELFLLDISATQDERKTFFRTMEQIADCVSIPVGIGGGIASVGDASKALLAGAEKVGINSAAVQNPELIKELSEHFGSQCVVVSIDAKRISTRYRVVTKSGTSQTDLDVIHWAARAVELGAGEIMLTSIDRDGTRQGYDLELYKQIRSAVSVPVIASGGAGTIQDVIELYRTNSADAALLAGIIHDQTIHIKDIKKELIDSGYIVRS